jgi:3-isopropylmalate dehydrogenase
MAQSKTANIVVLGGDGVGPEVVAEAIKILNIVNDKRSAARHTTFKFEEELIGLASMDKTGKVYWITHV